MTEIKVRNTKECYRLWERLLKKREREKKRSTMFSTLLDLKTLSEKNTQKMTYLITKLRHATDEKCKVL